jgi:hypothetical protein
VRVRKKWRAVAVKESCILVYYLGVIRRKDG